MKNLNLYKLCVDIQPDWNKIEKKNMFFTDHCYLIYLLRYQLKSTANSAFGPFFEVNGLDWQCYLAGSSKTAPRILILSIAIGANYS
jgi:hypothetical protein